MSSFWKNWLMTWCAGVALFGVVLILGGFPATAGPAQRLLELLGGAPAPAIDGALRFCVALLGAVTLGWSLTVIAAINAAIALGDRGAATWRGIVVSIVVWFVIDSSLSVATGFGLNAVSNGVLLVTFLVPIVASGVLRPRAPAYRPA